MTDSNLENVVFFGTAEQLSAQCPLYELCALLKVKKGTLKRWRHEGMPSELIDGRVYVVPSLVLEWLKSRPVRPSTFDKSCLVYFASAGNRIKIGSSVDPADRVRKMDVEILATVEGDKPTELAFHELFADARIAGEWFRPVPELLELIDSLKAA